MLFRSRSGIASAYYTQQHRLTLPVAFLFSRHWKGEAVLQCVFASLFVWSLITAFYFQYLEYNIWAVFFVGVPVQIALILGAKLRRAGVHWLRR